MWEVCDECKGKRYNKETLAGIPGKNIADVLDMPITEACEFFKDQEKIPPLSVLAEVSLGYLRLGQSVTTLSGGEARRLKLATELASTRNSGVLYLLDEPTTGRSTSRTFSSSGTFSGAFPPAETVVVIEHQPDVIRLSDWIVRNSVPKGATAAVSALWGAPVPNDAADKFF